MLNEKTDKEKLHDLRTLGIAMRRAQYAYFKQVKANKTNGAAYVDTLPLLNESKAAERAFDNKIKQQLELEALAKQPQFEFNHHEKIRS